METSGRQMSYSPEAVALTVLLSVHLAARVLVYAMGLEFDLQLLTGAWQLADIELLRNDLTRTLVYMHAQPPGFNLLTGLVLKLFPGIYAEVLQAIALLGGLVSAGAFYATLRLLGFAPWLSCAVTVIGCSANPVFILYEHLWFYDHLLITLLVVAGCCLCLYGRMKSHGALIAFFFCILCVAGTRSLFHLAWIIGLAGALAFLHRTEWRRIMLLSLIAIIPVLTLYAKNATLYGEFGSSSWLGMNIYKLVKTRLDPEAVQALADRGVVSPIAPVDPFEPLENYPIPDGEKSQSAIPLLADPYKSTGEPNFHHLDYIYISSQLKGDTIAIIRNDPALYIRSYLTSWLAFFMPASELYFFKENLESIDGYDTLWRRTWYLQPDWLADMAPSGATERIGRVSFTQFFLFVFVLTVGTWLLIRLWRRDAEDGRLPYLLFVQLTLIYIALIGNSLEVGENFRFRLMMELPMLAAGIVYIRALLSPRWSCESD